MIMYVLWCLMIHGHHRSTFGTLSGLAIWSLVFHATRSFKKNCNKSWVSEFIIVDVEKKLRLVFTVLTPTLLFPGLGPEVVDLGCPMIKHMIQAQFVFWTFHLACIFMLQLNLRIVLCIRFWSGKIILVDVCTMRCQMTVLLC